MLLSLHTMGAAILKVPELRLEPEEAKPLAAAAAKVASFYAGTIDPKLLAWFNLTAVAGGLYVPRWFAIQARLRQEALPRVAAAPVPKPTSGDNWRSGDYAGAAYGANGKPPVPTDGVRLMDVSELRMGPPTD